MYRQSLVVLSAIFITQTGALTTFKLRHAVPYLLTMDDVLRPDRSIIDDEGESIVERLQIEEVTRRTDINGVLTRIHLRTEKREMNIDLQAMNKIMSPNLRVTVTDGDKTQESPIHSSLKDIFFHGKVEGVDGGIASLMRDTNGWKGMVFVQGEALAINHERSTGEHLLIKVINDDVVGALPLMKGIDQKRPNNWKRSKNAHERRQRDISSLKLELGVYTDQALYELMVNNSIDDPVGEVQRMALLIINTVNIYYQKPHLGAPVEVVVAKLVIFKKDPASILVREDVRSYLNSFCLYETTYQNPRGLNYDIAVLLTGSDLRFFDSNLVAGMGHLGGACYQNYRISCVISEANDLVGGTISAHEIGHNLNMDHDGYFNDCPTEGYIMEPGFSPGSVTFSSCSKEYFDVFMEKLDDFNINCLRTDVSQNNVDFEPDVLPGELLLDNEQCNKLLGASWEDYHNESYCSQLLCKKEDKIISTAFPPVPGSRCGENKICWNAECLDKAVVRELSQRQYNSSVSPDSLTLDELCVKYGDDTYTKGVAYDEGFGWSSEFWRGICNAEGVLCFTPDLSTYMTLNQPAPPGTPCFKNKVCKHYECNYKDAPDPPMDSSNAVEVVEQSDVSSHPLSEETRNDLNQICKTYLGESAIHKIWTDCGFILCHEGHYLHWFNAYLYNTCPEGQMCTFEGACVEDSGEPLPGELTKEELKDADKLCRDKYGQQYQSVCRRAALSFSQTANELCADGLCETVACFGFEYENFHIEAFPTPDGSPCGNGKQCGPKGCTGIIITQKLKNSSKKQGIN